MGQEISQPNKCNIGRRHQQQQQQQQQPLHLHQNLENFRNFNEKQSSIQNNWSGLNLSSSSNEEQQKHTLHQAHQQHHQKQHHHHHHHQEQPQSFCHSPTSYDRSAVNKKLSLLSNASATSDYQNVSVTSNSSCGSGKIHPYTPQSLYYDKLYKKDSDTSEQLSYVQLRQHQRKHSQGTDSGIYCTSSVSSTCRCSSSSAASICGSSAGSASTASNKSFDKQKSYLSHHLYIKSYLDILEEDEKASAHFKPARPGIRNYTPKILTTDTSAGIGANLATSAAVGVGVAARKAPRSKIKDDPWI